MREQMIEKAVNEYGKLPRDPTVKVRFHTACLTKPNILHSCWLLIAAQPQQDPGLQSD